MIVELVWDSKLFKKKIGKLTKVPSEMRLKRLINQAYEEGYSYLTCRIIEGRIADIQRLEACRFYTTDIGIVWERKTDGIALREGDPVRVADKRDAAALKSMANGLFLDSRFYHDPFFTGEDAEKAYHRWIDTALRDKLQKTFLVDGSGFITCKKLSDNDGDISLVGVVSQKQGKGIGHNLVRKAFDWFSSEGLTNVTVRTQATNTRAMNFYAGLGFRVKYMDTTVGLILKKIK